jgi:ribonuclease P protein component
MLPTKRRVKKESFAKIMKDGVFLHAPNLYLRFLDRKDESPSLFGFVVPNKVKKTSVGRHLIKRKLTAMVEKALPNTKSGLSCLFFVKKDTTLLSDIEIEKEIIDLLKKGKILS